MQPDQLRKKIRFGPFRRIAREASVENLRYNTLYRTFQSYFQAVLTAGNSAEWEASDLKYLYTSRRLSDHDDWSIDQFSRDLPESLLKIESIGETEATMLSWLFSDPGPRVLTVLGLTGIGKTTLIRYVFFYIRSQCPEMKAYHPIYTDFRSTVTDAMEQDLLLAIFSAAIETLRSDESQIPEELLSCRERIVSDNLPASREAFNHFLTMFIDHLGDIQPVLLLDNVDQLKPSSVGDILNIARICDIKHKLKVAISMRPPVFWSDVEKHLDRDSFVKRSLTVRPPDLGMLIAKRLKLFVDRDPDAPSKFVISARQRIPLELDTRSIEKVFNRITEFFLNKQVQQTISCNLCNYDTRRAFTAIHAYLKYRELPVEEFADKYLKAQVGIQDEDRGERRRFGRLISGIMNEDRVYYRERVPDERRQHVVMNVLSSGHRAVGRHNTIQCRWLCLLGWKSSLLERDWCLNVLQNAGFDRDLCINALQRLIQFGLIVSPQTEYLAGDARQLRISSTGRYYFESLICDHAYLFNVIMDLPLNHVKWDSVNPATSIVSDSAQDFKMRITSLFELLLHVIDSERNELMTPTLPSWWGGMLASTSLLSSQLLRGVVAILRTGKHSRRRSVVNAASEIEDKSITMYESELAELESLLSNRVGERDQNIRSLEVTTLELQGGGRATLEFPMVVPYGRVVPIEVRIEKSRMQVGRSVGAFVDIDVGELAGDKDPCLTFSAGFPESSDSANVGRVLVRRKKGSKAGVSGRVLYTADGYILGQQLFVLQADAGQ